MTYQNKHKPFGMRLSGKTYTNPTQTNANKYLYNGKELQNDFGLQWYDYGFRMYDRNYADFQALTPKQMNFLLFHPIIMLKSIL